MTTLNIGISADDIQYPDMEARIEADVAFLMAGKGNSLSNDVTAVLLARMGTGDMFNDRFTRAASGLDFHGEALFADLSAILQSTAHTVIHPHNEDGSPTPEAINYRRVACLAASIAVLLATVVPGIDDI